MLPDFAIWPSESLTPKRLLSESRPNEVEPAAFLCAIQVGEAAALIKRKRPAAFVLMIINQYSQYNKIIMACQLVFFGFFRLIIARVNGCNFFINML